MAEEIHKKYIPLEHAARNQADLRQLEKLCVQGKLDAKKLKREWFLAANDLSYAQELARGFNFPDLLPLAKSATVILLILGGGWLFGHSLRQVQGWQNPKAPVGPEVMLAAAEPVFERVTLSLADLYGEWQDFLKFVSSEIFYYNYRLRTAWSNFGGKKEPPAVTAITLNPNTTVTDKETLKNEIKKELLAEIERVSNLPPNSDGGNNQGLVVFPSTGDPKKDALTQEIIKEAFSSEISLQVDSSGRAGIITPVFQNTNNGNYLFLITPIQTGP